jgi:predicted glycosyltransferase
VILCATKFSEAKDVLPRLAAAVRSLTTVHMIIKAHPAEGTDGYAALAGGNISVVPATESLGALLALADAVVTVNSTVAVDALVLGIPALSIGQPNNLLPFVEAGAMLGANTERDIGDALSQLVSEAGLRAVLVQRGVALVGDPSNGSATENAAQAILAMAETFSRQPVS